MQKSRTLTDPWSKCKCSFTKKCIIYLIIGNLVVTSQGWTTHANTQKPCKTLLETSGWTVLSGNKVNHNAAWTRLWVKSFSHLVLQQVEQFEKLKSPPSMPPVTLLLAVRQCDIRNRTSVWHSNIKCPFRTLTTLGGWREVCAVSCPAEGPRWPTIEEFLHCCHSCQG